MKVGQIMSLQLVGNRVSSVKFTSKHDKNDVLDARAQAAAFVNMSDEQLKSLAYLTTRSKKGEKNHQNAVITSLYALPAVDILSRGILKRASNGAPATLSKRLLTSSKVAMGWGGALVLLGGLNSVKHKLASKSDNYKKFEYNNPLASLAVDFAMFAGLLTLGKKAKNAVLNKFQAAKPGAIFKSARKIVARNQKLDSGFVNKNILGKIIEKSQILGAKVPLASSVGRSILRNSVWIVLIAGLFSQSSNAKKDRAKIEKQFVNLKKGQFEVAKLMSNVLGVEKDVLTQDQPELAKDLNRSMDGKKPVSDEELQDLDEQIAESKVESEVDADMDDESVLVD